MNITSSSASDKDNDVLCSHIGNEDFVEMNRKHIIDDSKYEDFGMSSSRREMMNPLRIYFNISSS